MQIASLAPRAAAASSGAKPLSADRPAATSQAAPLDVWSALIAACMSPDDYVVIERNGELVIEPAARLQ